MTGKKAVVREDMVFESGERLLAGAVVHIWSDKGDTVGIEWPDAGSTATTHSAAVLRDKLTVVEGGTT